jgi:hypothetical protein
VGSVLCIRDSTATPASKNSLIPASAASST